MNEPLVSIIVPCYNAGSHLAEALTCLVNQTHKNLEIITVNDGSTDNTEEVIKSVDDKRIRYYNQENKGQCAASNFGLSKATGAYIKFFDSDDIMNPEHIEEQVKKIAGSTTAVASCAWGRFYNDNPASAKFVAEPVWKDLKPIDWLKTALSQKSDMMGAWLWLIPTDLIKKSGGWDERLSLNNDFEFSTRLLLHASDVLFTPKATLVSFLILLLIVSAIKKL